MGVKKANNPTMEKEFDRIWKEAWKEKNFEFEYNDKAIPFVFEKDGEYVASFTFSPVSEHLLENGSPFSNHPEILDNLHNTVELDKLSILKDERGKSILTELLVFMLSYAEENNVTHYVALCEPMLYVAFLRIYKIPVKKAGEKFYYKGDMVQPIIIDVEASKKQFKKRFLNDEKKNLAKN